MKTSWSAGVLVFRNRKPLVHEYLFVIREDGLLALPSGHKEDHETIAQTAIRETLEETGFHVKLICFQPIRWSITGSEKVSVRVVFLAQILDKKGVPEHPITWLTSQEILQAMLEKTLFRPEWQLEGYETIRCSRMEDIAKEVERITKETTSQV